MLPFPSPTLQCSCQRRTAARQSLCLGTGPAEFPREAPAGSPPAPGSTEAPQLSLPFPGCCSGTASTPQSEMQFICSVYLVSSHRPSQGWDHQQQEASSVSPGGSGVCSSPGAMGSCQTLPKLSLSLGRFAVVMAPLNPLIPAVVPVICCFHFHLCIPNFPSSTPCLPMSHEVSLQWHRSCSNCSRYRHWRLLRSPFHHVKALLHICINFCQVFTVSK